jgi:hypothetical protein
VKTVQLPTPRANSRSDLLTLLSEASELEHGLACSYLFTAFTLKSDLAEGGLTWQQLQMVRQWAAQIFFVASEEMLHLSQAWNLLSAVGGTPYYLRPNFPQSSKYYPLGLPLRLERFNRAAIERFIAFELPSEAPPERVSAEFLGMESAGVRPDGFRTVGELYRQIAEAVCAIPEAQLFVGNPEKQIGPDLVDFPDLIKVVNRKTALAAIETITEQGEGTVPDRKDCHYGAFVNIRDQFVGESERASVAGQVFVPARPAIENPAARLRGDLAAEKVNIIEDEYVAECAELFDAIYNLMLRQLQYVFSGNSDDPRLLRRFASVAIAVMPTVIKPLGEALTMLPAGKSYHGQTAGPAFAMTRHVPLPTGARAASTVVDERLGELIAEAERLANDNRAPQYLVKAAENLHRITAGH